MKRTVFLLCEKCGNVFMSTNVVVAEKSLSCGHGCSGDLKEITKAEATAIFLEKNDNERARF